MQFAIVRHLTVRREFQAGADAGTLEVRRDCGIGCTCGATIWKAELGTRLAEDKTLCFNDRTKEGISEIANTAKLVSATAGVTVYEVQAHLVRHNAA